MPSSTQARRARKTSSQGKPRVLPFNAASVQVALATLVDKAPEGDGWVHEIKLDGYRMLAQIADGACTLWTRNAKEWTARLPTVAAALNELSAENALLDGEVVFLKPNGVSDFQSLQNGLSDQSAAGILYYAFDLLLLDGVDVRGLSLLERKARLETLLRQSGVDTSKLRLSEHVTGKGGAFFTRACKAGLEGIISKRADAPYRGGRGRDWLKVKCTARQELVVVGFTKPKGARQHFGALLLATRDGKVLRFAGKVGTGFSEKSLRELHAKLLEHPRASAPCEGAPTGSAARNVQWIEPVLVAEVEFTEFTKDGMLRHPTFRGLRDDKPASQVVRERRPVGAKR